MRSIREILRLKAEGVPDREIAASVGCARSTLCECLKRAAPLPLWAWATRPPSARDKLLKGGL